MRKVLIGLLMAATVATPVATAAAQDRSRDRGARSEARQERQSNRAEQRAPRAAAQRAERPAQRAQRSEQRAQRQDQRGPRPEQRAQAQRVQVAQSQRRGDRDGSRYQQHIRDTRAASRASAQGSLPRYQRQAAENQRRYEQQLRERRNDRRDDRRDWRQDRREDRRDWNRGWRQDRRYDWQRYRATHRTIYRPGRYYAPYRNHHYSRLSIGLFLGAGFYGSNYWLNDPWQYRLPPAEPGTRWVRYYGDVLLVDTYNGEVIDVIYDFFW